MDDLGEVCIQVLDRLSDNELAESQFESLSELAQNDQFLEAAFQAYMMYAHRPDVPPPILMAMRQLFFGGAHFLHIFASTVPVNLAGTAINHIEAELKAHSEAIKRDMQ